MIVPALVIYETRRGLLRAGATRLLQRLDRFLRAFAHVDDFDAEEAEEAARLWAERQGAGRPAGEIDLLILASALAHGADVVTDDEGFPTAAGVRLLRWPDLLPRDGGGEAAVIDSPQAPPV